MGEMQQAMHGARDTLQIWACTAREKMFGLDFCASALHPPVYWHPVRLVTIVMHADDLLCIGPSSELQWLFKSLQKEYDEQEYDEHRFGISTGCPGEWHKGSSGSAIQNMCGRWSGSVGWRGAGERRPLSQRKDRTTLWEASRSTPNGRISLGEEPHYQRCGPGSTSSGGHRKYAVPADGEPYQGHGVLPNTRHSVFRISL